MRGKVLRLTAQGTCEVRTENDILFVLPVPSGADVQPSDELELGQPILDGVLRVLNLTRGGTFDTTVKAEDVHDLRLPARHAASRSPTLERLNGP